MTVVPTLTFAGGQLSKGLWGRVDLAKYQTGVKQAKNMTVAIEGGLRKRVGQYYIGKTKVQPGTNFGAKLIGWRIADDDSYMLEFGHNYIRFIRLGGYVAIPGGWSHVAGNDASNVSGFMEIATPYTAAECRELKYTFANDVMYIWHKNHQPRTLTRLSLYDWDFALMSFNPHDTAPTGLAVTWEAYLTGSSSWGTATYPTALPSGYNAVKNDIRYKVSAIMADGLETLPSAEVLKVSDLGDTQLRNRITWSAKTGATEYRIYKGDNGIFGFIGSVLAPDTEFIDKNFAPSYDLVPIKDFAGFGSSQWPRVGEFYKQRLAHAATAAATQKMWFSRPLFFTALSRSVPAQEDDAIEFTLVGNSRHTINHLMQLKKFIIFTDSGEWVLGTVGDQALSIATADPIMETNYGSNPNLAPKAIGDRVLFVQNISSNLLDMGYDFASDAYKADDLSRLSRDLFKGTSIISWAYSDHPGNILPCVCANGTMPVLTYARQHEIWGWSYNETVGKYLDVATVAEGDQQAVYYQVERTINGVKTCFVERSEELFTDRIDDLFYVDCGLTYVSSKGFTTLVRDSDTQIKITVPGHTETVGQVVQVETGDFIMKFTVTNVNVNVLTLSSLYGKIVPETLAYLEGAMFSCSSTFTGYQHLANTTGLVALGDGNVFKNISIDGSGNFTLPVECARVHCGFPYEGRIRTLGLDPSQMAGRYYEKTPTRIKVNLENSRGVLVGNAAAKTRDLVSIIPRSGEEDMDESNMPLDGIYEIPSHVAWDYTAEIIVSAPDPLPCHVLNIIPDLSYDN